MLFKALSEFEWVKSARRRRAEELCMEEPGRCHGSESARPIESQPARKQAFMRVVEAFEAHPAGQ
jgi:hypothetical protein